MAEIWRTAGISEMQGPCWVVVLGRHAYLARGPCLDSCSILVDCLLPAASIGFARGKGK